MDEIMQHSDGAPGIMIGLRSLKTGRGGYDRRRLNPPRGRAVNERTAVAARSAAPAVAAAAVAAAA